MKGAGEAGKFPGERATPPGSKVLIGGVVFWVGLGLFGPTHPPTELGRGLLFHDLFATGG
jgi:hypothetical protein